MIDFVITMGVAAIFRGIGFSVETAAMVAAFFGFVVSAVVNYLLSMKYVFARKEDMNRKKEFIIFMLLSVIGLGINELLVYYGVIVGTSLLAGFDVNIITAAAKIFATAVVMVYNFVTRKIFLENKNVDSNKDTKSDTKSETDAVNNINNDERSAKQ